LRKTQAVLDFTPFALRPDAELSPAWLGWLGDALSGGQGPAKLPPPGKLAPPPDDPAAVLPALATHGLAPLIYLSLRDRAGSQGWPPAVLAALADAFQTNAVRSYMMETELARISAALAGIGTPLALLKGAATGRTVYGSPAARLVNDLDLLVPADRVEQARAAVAALGYDAHGPLGSGRFGRWQRRYRCELQMVCTHPDRRGLLVELHWSLVELPYYVERIPMAEVWATARPAEGLLGASLPDPATLLLHGCAHVSLHHSRALRLIWLVDVDRLARSEALDWDALSERSARWGLGLAAYTTLKTTAAWLGTPLPAAVMARLVRQADDPMLRAMWGLGDEVPGGARHRARATWMAFSGRQRLRYGAWMASRALVRPFEAAGRAGTPHPQTAAADRDPATASGGVQ
jgi:hypothetical protein